MVKVRITVDGKLALTVEQAAERYHYSYNTMQVVLSRLGLERAGWLDGRKPLYLAAEVDTAMKSRPGKGWRGVPRQRQQEV